MTLSDFIHLGTLTRDSSFTVSKKNLDSPNNWTCIIWPKKTIFPRKANKLGKLLTKEKIHTFVYFIMVKFPNICHEGTHQNKQMPSS